MGRTQAVAAATAPGAPGELVELQIHGRRQRWFKTPPCETLRGLYESTASDLLFLVYQDEHWTFAQAWADAARIAVVLQRDCGVKQGDRVAIAMRNYPEWVLAFTAATAIGAVAVAVNAHWTADELDYGLRDCGAVALVADDERIARWAAGPSATARPAPLQVLAVRPAAGQPLPEGVRALQALMDATGARGAVAMPAVDIAPDDLAIMLYTSGSTGHPKGVPSTHRQVLAGLFSWELDKLIGELAAGATPPPPAEQPGTLLAVPLFHATGSHASYLSSYRAQRRMVCMYRWDADEAAQLIQRHRLTSVVAPSAVTGDLVRVAYEKRYDLSTLLMVGGGGAPRPPEQVKQIHQSFGQAQPNIGWGMTETNAIGTGHAGEDYLQRPSSSGRAAQLLDLRVVGDDGRPLAAGQRGELQVRGTSVFNGYWNLPQANAQAFAPDDDGGGPWFRTGDVAYLDDEGFLFIVDRIKDLIIRGGENIGCGAVEGALSKHPLVHEAAVYGVPDARLGEEVGATVYGAPGLDADALRMFLQPHLAKFEIPRYLLVSATPLARTPSGKLLKRTVRAQALAELAAQGLWHDPQAAGPVPTPGPGPA